MKVAAPFLLLHSLLFGCGSSGLEPEQSYAEPDVAIWAEQLGSVREPAQACVGRHPEPGAVIYGVRTLRSGELALMTYCEKSGAVVCVHDGKKVVHQSNVTLAPEQLARLPFVVLGDRLPEPGPAGRVLRELHWGSRFVGWLVEPRRL